MTPIFDLGVLQVRPYGLALAASLLVGWYVLRGLEGSKEALRAFTLGVTFAVLAGLGARAAGSVVVFAALAVGCSVSTLLAPKQRALLAIAWSASASALFLGAGLEGTFYGPPHEGWALAYGGGSLARADHLARGWINERSTHSLRTLPLAAYAAFGALLSTGVTFALRRRAYGASIGFLLLGITCALSTTFRDDPLRGEGALVASLTLLLLAFVCAWWTRVEQARFHLEPSPQRSP